jgi:hypothetical protein
MAIRFYDEAIKNKIQSWIKDPNMVVLKPDEVSQLFKIKADQTKDKTLSLPFVALSRDTSIELNSNIKQAMTFNGYPIKSTDKVTYTFDAIPITVNYQLDIFTQKYEEGDEYLRNFIFQLINNPKLLVTIPYNNFKLQHLAYLRVMPTITDNSDVSERLYPNEFTRWTIQLELQDAYLFSIPANTNWTIDTSELILTDDTSTLIEKEPIDVNN